MSLMSPKSLKILLICTGNTCRSPMAEGLLKKLLEEEMGDLMDVEVSSAGLFAAEGETASPEAIRVMRERGIDISGHRVRQATVELVKEADLVLTMTSGHKEHLLRIMPEARGKVFTLKEFGEETGVALGKIDGDRAQLARGFDISDPFGKPVESYKESAREIEEALKKVIRRLKNVRRREDEISKGEEE